MELTKMRLIVLLGTIAALSGFNCFLLDNQNTTKIDHSMTGHTTMSPPTKIDQNTTDKTSTDQNNTDSGVIIKVTPGLYVAVGFAFANSIMVDAPDGLIIVDTTGGVDTGREVLKEFRKISNKTIKAIIYTHQHPDHTWGAKAFVEDPKNPPDIWAHYTTTKALNLFLTVGGNARMIRSYRQFGGTLDYTNGGFGLLYPNKFLRDERLDTNIAGLNLTLYHIPGETDDQIGVYIPRDNAFLSGDDFYQAFPNIYTIRGATARNAVDWYTSLDKIIDIEPEHLIPSHGSPFSGKQVIRDLLTPYRDAIQYVHDQTVRLMNKGMVPNDIAHMIQLPESLRNQSSLQQIYGTTFWSVKGIFTKYLGWFSGDPADLFSMETDEKASMMTELVGGLDNLAEAAEKALNDTKYQWALELSSHALKVNNSCTQARNVKVEALKALGAQQKSSISRNYYRTCAEEDSTTTSISPSIQPNPSLVEFLPIEEIFVIFRLKYQPDMCGDRNTTAMFVFPDVNKTISIRLRNGVAVVKSELLNNADIKVTTSASVWKQLIATHFQTLMSNLQQIKIDGGIGNFLQFLSCFQG